MLSAQPSIACWVGEHTRLMVLNAFVLVLYFFFLPATYTYVLGYRVRKQGLYSERLNKLFGFLWARFEPRTYWWELGEILLRKLPLLLIEFLFENAVVKCIIGCFCVAALMILNFTYAPYLKFRYDILDQVVCAAQLAVFVLGIVVEYREEDRRARSIDAVNFDDGRSMEFAVMVISLVVFLAAAVRAALPRLTLDLPLAPNS